MTGRRKATKTKKKTGTRKRRFSAAQLRAQKRIKEAYKSCKGVGEPFSTKNKGCIRRWFKEN